MLCYVMLDYIIDSCTLSAPDRLKSLTVVHFQHLKSPNQSPAYYKPYAMLCYVMLCYVRLHHRQSYWLWLFWSCLSLWLSWLLLLWSWKVYNWYVFSGSKTQLLKLNNWTELEVCKIHPSSMRLADFYIRILQLSTISGGEVLNVYNCRWCNLT